MYPLDPDDQIIADGAAVASVARLVREDRGSFELPDLRVHRDDEMWGWGQLTCATPAIGQFSYFRSGLVISRTVRELVQWWCPDGPDAVLDFACGYGRSLRYTIADFGADRVWGAEILPGAVEFVGGVLGANALASSTDPAELDLGRQFDLIFVSSLFSHLPEHTFVPWLARLHEHLTPNGLLAISVHDEFLLPPGESLSASGIFFQPTTEVTSLDTSEYGATVVNETFVARAIEQATGSPTHRRLPTALCFEQDVYLVAARADADLSGFELVRGAQGVVDFCDFGDGELALQGWAATQDDGAVVDHVDVRIDGELVLRRAPSVARPDVLEALHGRNPDLALVSGWDARLTCPPARPDAVVSVTAVCAGGRRDEVWSTEVSAFGTPPDPEVVDVTASTQLERIRRSYDDGGVTGVAAAAGRRLRAEVRRRTEFRR